MSKRDLWNERYANKELVWSAGPNKLFAEEVKDLPAAKSIDIACGEGRNALWLAEQGWDSTGIDFSDEGIDKGRQIAAKRGLDVHWIAEDASTYALPKNEFDLVAVLYLHTEHDEMQAWLQNALNAVKPSGTFIYIGHDPSNIEHGVGGPQNPDFLPSAEVFTQCMTGFDVERAEVIERPIVNEPGHGRHELKGIALDTLVRAVKKPA
jgi:SAM-dependent methyltransferase